MDIAISDRYRKEKVAYINAHGMPTQLTTNLKLSLSKNLWRSCKKIKNFIYKSMTAFTRSYGELSCILALQ